MSEHPYPLYDEKGKVTCQICGKAYLVISPRHLQTHNIKYADYTSRFPKAPLSNEEFKARGKYGKNKDMFIQPEPDAKVEKNEYLSIQDGPEIEELDDIEKFIKQESSQKDPIRSMKIRFRDHLRLHFSNIQMDYLIRQFGTDNKLKFEFITDYCDPVLRIVVQFPNTFWHNEDMLVDLNKKTKLEQYGWKVYEIRSNNPSLNKIDNVIDNES